MKDRNKVLRARKIRTYFRFYRRLPRHEKIAFIITCTLMGLLMMYAILMLCGGK